MWEFKGSYQLGTLTGEVLDKWVNGFWLKLYQGPMPGNLFKQPKTRTVEDIGEFAPTTKPVP